ncbi:Hydrolase of the alpha/beta superfamily [Pediococcus damnosus]|uniref:alpha/beta hydrolase n=2 Tax=Pediococcus damnosus TaxID=51663 RepID=UPI00078EA723|nr:alpha/beta hydrolase [Pediococcus damnosus]AMV60869.1 hydrolase of the alpha/beta superfamily [Pediococcus damnosus]AMV65228.1 Hydrolase of the alpha/beta superfamily [Pediococcus damnosus]
MSFFIFLIFKTDKKPVLVIHQYQKVQTQNTRPFLFIHGEKDIYVPTYMVDESFEACPDPKEIWIVPNASHAESFWINPQAYQTKIQQFIDKYSK